MVKIEAEVKTIKFNYALSIDNTEGYILLSDMKTKAEIKAREVWKATDELNKQQIEDIMKVSEEMFLGLKSIKGGFEIGILVYTGKPTLPTLEGISQALIMFHMINDDNE